MGNIRWIAAVVALSLAAGPAGANTLYKWIGSDGVVQFSDVPPDDKSFVLERRPIASVASASAGSPPANLMNVPQSLDADEGVVRANAQVDLAEHALALARRSMGAKPERLRLTTHRATASDVERVEFYKRGVVAARRNLMDVLRMRSTATVLASR